MRFRLFLNLTLLTVTWCWCTFAMWRLLWEDAHQYLGKSLYVRALIYENHRWLFYWLILSMPMLDGGGEEHIYTWCCADNLNTRWYVRCSKRPSWPFKRRVSQQSAILGGRAIWSCCKSSEMYNVRQRQINTGSSRSKAAGDGKPQRELHISTAA